MARKVGSTNRASLLAHAEMERLGLSPIEMIKAVYDRAIAAYDSHRGDNEKSDAGSSYLSVAGQMAVNLARFKHPTLSAVAVKDIDSDKSDKQPITTEEAIKIIRSDPFAPADISSERVVDAMKSGIQAPLLPGSSSERS